MSQQIIAIDLGGTSAKVGLVTPKGEVIRTWSVATDNSDQGSHIIPNLIQAIQEELRRDKIHLSSIKGIGMGSPGAVDHQAKTVEGAYNLNWRTQQNIGQAFQEALGLPFYIDNDANVAALGEQWQGAGAAHDDMVMVTLGTGVGGGIIIDGFIHHGVGAAGEVGHLSVDFESRIPCTCGKLGCLEAVASATGIVNLYHHYRPGYSGQSALIEAVEGGEELSSLLIFNHAAAGDNYADQLVERYAHYLGLGCSHIATILHPGMIVLGGGVSQAGDFLLHRVDQHYQEYTFPQIKAKTRLALATLGNDAGMLGAAHLVNLGEANKEN